MLGGVGRLPGNGRAYPISAIEGAGTFRDFKHQ
jgi:hypothetical protein